MNRRTTFISVSAATLLFLVGCGSTSTERVELVSTCKMETPLAINTDTPGAPGLVLTDVVFYSNPTSPSVQQSRGATPLEISLFNVTVLGQTLSDLLGFSLTPASAVGFLAAYNQTADKPSDVDEEGYRHYYPTKRNLSGRVKQEGQTYKYSSRMAEGVVYKELSTKVVLTALRATVENKALTALEINIPITKTFAWRDTAPLGLPLLEQWMGTNEALCVKSAKLKAR